MSDAWSRERALRYAYWLLSRRDYARAELVERLQRKPVAPEVRDAVLARLDELDYLDDARFARGFVRARSADKGRWALRRELARRGVPEAVAEEALEGLDDAHQEAAARAVLRKHAWRFASADADRDRARAAAFLARRGFPPDAARAALEAAFAEASEEGTATGEAAARRAPDGERGGGT